QLMARAVAPVVVVRQPNAGTVVGRVAAADRVAPRLARHGGDADRYPLVRRAANVGQDADPGEVSARDELLLQPSDERSVERIAVGEAEEAREHVVLQRAVGIERDVAESVAGS